MFGDSKHVWASLEDNMDERIDFGRHNGVEVTLVHAMKMGSCA